MKAVERDALRAFVRRRHRRWERPGCPGCQVIAGSLADG